VCTSIGANGAALAAAALAAACRGSDDPAPAQARFREELISLRKIMD